MRFLGKPLVGWGWVGVNRLKQWRGIATRYDKRAGNYRAARCWPACCGGWMMASSDREARAAVCGVDTPAHMDLTY